VSAGFTGLPRAAVVVPTAIDWQPVVSFDLATDRQRLLERATTALEGRVEVVDAAVVVDASDAAEAGDRAARAGAEAVLVVATMAVLPAVPLAALERLPGSPVVIWAAQQAQPLTDDVAHERVVTDGGTVGAPMLTSMLVRDGHPFEVVLGRFDDPGALDRVACSLRAAAAARRLARARLGRVGDPARGYDCVVLDEQRLSDTIGVRVVPIEPRELARLYHAVPAPVLAEVVEETRSLYELDAALQDEDLVRACRGAAALERLVQEHELDAGALTCHVPGLRFEPGLGFAPCFALGRMTSKGVPWSCSCDVPAALGLATLTARGAAAQYHELELVDPDGDEFLVASSGEHDLAFAGGERPRLVRNAWFPNDAHPSVCACFSPPPGPATLLGFVQLDRPIPAHRLVVARGTFGSRRFDRVATPNAAFRFAVEPAADAWAAWCRGGVALHAAATPGDLAAPVEALGRFLGVEVVRV
jgi:L-arabinose isomerase